MKRILVTILLALSMIASMAIPALAATTQDVTVTATPTYIALTNDDADWVIGAVVINTKYWWTTDGNAPAPEPFEAADMIATITNTGSVSEDVDVKAAAFTGGVGWALSADDTPAADEVAVYAAITGCANEAAMIRLTVADQELKDALAAAGTVKWCMKLLTASAFGDGVAKSGTITLTASAAD